jgi:hypothetical protein
VTVQCVCVSVLVRVFSVVALETQEEPERKRRMYDKIGRRISSREGVMGEIHREAQREGKGRGDREICRQKDRHTGCLSETAEFSLR